MKKASNTKRFPLVLGKGQNATDKRRPAVYLQHGLLVWFICKVFRKMRQIDVNYQNSMIITEFEKNARVFLA